MERMENEITIPIFWRTWQIPRSNGSFFRPKYGNLAGVSGSWGRSRRQEKKTPPCQQGDAFRFDQTENSCSTTHSAFQPHDLPKQRLTGQVGVGQHTVTGTCSQITLGTHRVTV